MENVVISLTPHALNAIHSSLQHTLTSTQNALAEVQQQTQVWQMQQQAAALVAQQRQVAEQQVPPADAAQMNGDTPYTAVSGRLP